MIKAVRGTRDLLPPDTALWNFVEVAARDIFRVYNFHEIRTPIFEETQLFSRSVGLETDIVAKEMFSWEDRRRGPRMRCGWASHRRVRLFRASPAMVRRWPRHGSAGSRARTRTGSRDMSRCR